MDEDADAVIHHAPPLTRSLRTLPARDVIQLSTFWKKSSAQHRPLASAIRGRPIRAAAVPTVVWAPAACSSGRARERDTAACVYTLPHCYV